MIPVAHVTEWRQQAPWADDADVEQDLVISRAIVDLSNDPFLYDRLGFRGGTPLHKIVLPPASRYSDDIDLVFLLNEGIGPVFDHVKAALRWLDPDPRRDTHMFPKLYFRFTTANGEKRRLKVEVATRESFSAGRTVDMSYGVTARYFTGRAAVRTYSCEELLATKLRALYQRQKGRDLYDLWYATHQRTIDLDLVYQLFLEYWKATGLPPLRRGAVVANMAEKKERRVFEDVLPLLAPGTAYDPDAAQRWFDADVLPRFPV